MLIFWTIFLCFFLGKGEVEGWEGDFRHEKFVRN
ncbi:Hypothetical protein CpCP13_1914 [Corynebacterium pseudotuberculosis]|nr:Hypothetical protein CpPAT10_1876a [Corynebacterium pseudotuberculosis PAT10]AEP71099.1 Hypothetical protein Cp4202_1865 [Corynebacterium pseudotuberculosis 42/02-A]AFF23023.1 Hypothetical protein CpP54B96_1905 [Corynebacterium pseudotuberculosis P54B96]AFH52825.1 Hypothetical protein Cp267_1945 [Corynebacterium pseudotuberculosis 267]ANQ78066.1 Hypothetical protein CpCP13_1914 [Corynebacterium pseudotuberculosis]